MIPGGMGRGRPAESVAAVEHSAGISGALPKTPTGGINRISFLWSNCVVHLRRKAFQYSRERQCPSNLNGTVNLDATHLNTKKDLHLNIYIEEANLFV